MAMKDYFQHVDETKLKRMLEIRTAYDNGKLSLAEAQEKLRNEVGRVQAYEFALIEQELKEFEEDECRKEDIQGMLKLFEGIFEMKPFDLPEDHPIQHYLLENQRMKELLLSVEDLVQYPVIKNQWMELYEEMLEWKIHLKRKQNQLYSLLEKKGFDRPTTTMWTLDDYIRDELNEAYDLIKNDQDDLFISKQETIVHDVKDLMDKEETVLYPTALEMITDAEFEEMKSGDQEIGFAFIDVKHENIVKEDKVDDSFKDELSALLAKHGYGNQTNTVLDVCTGKLTLEQINLIYKHMPVDLSFVDENEKVCFYSDTDHRVFPRSKNVIGRDVKNCHPRKSVHIVEEIIEKFRSGEEDHAEFWINKPDLFIYIYYKAVRDEHGNFKGILEMMQDATHIRSLQGSQTLLTWGSGKEEIQEIKEENEESKDVDIKEINGDTKLKDLLTIKPSLKDYLVTLNPNFKILNSPMAKLMIPKATLARMSERGDYPLSDLINKIQSFLNNN